MIGRLRSGYGRGGEGEAVLMTANVVRGKGDGRRKDTMEGESERTVGGGELDGRDEGA